jgi:Holliday junction resolvase RusA-like endonuclease
VIRLWIPGHPRTKGSLDERHQDTPQSKKWRALMAQALRYERERIGMPTAPKGIAVAVSAKFFLPTGDATTPNCGDLDKLLRNLLDAGTDAGVWADDVQVVRILSDKVAAGGGPQGVVLGIWAPDPVELAGWQRGAREARLAALALAGLDIPSDAPLG